MSIATPEVETISTPDVEVSTTSGNGSAKAHAIRPPQDWPGDGLNFLEVASAEGIELKALCGYTWTPKGPSKNLPVCETCLMLMEKAWDESDSE